MWGVATEPERRGAGLASACLGTLMDDARRRGTPLTALFPAVVEPYRRLGYELAGTYDEHRIALDVLPAVDKHDLPTVELAEAERDQDAIMACYSRWLARRNGTIEPDAAFWRARLSNARGTSGIVPSSHATTARSPASPPSRARTTRRAISRSASA